MLALAFFRWWYGHGWKDSINYSFGLVGKISQSFSVEILLKTLFSPWRRIMSMPGSGISAHIHAALDNLVSRFVGFWVRLFVLLAALVLSLLALITGFIFAAAWPLLPPATVALIIIGIIK